MKTLLLSALCALFTQKTFGQCQVVDTFNGGTTSLFEHDSTLCVTGSFVGTGNVSSINYAEYTNDIANPTITGFSAGICFAQAVNSTGEHIVSVGVAPFLKKVNPSTKIFEAYKDSADAVVYAMLPVGNGMMYGGAFTKINGVQSHYIAIVDQNGMVDTLPDDSGFRPVGNVTKLFYAGDFICVVYDSDGQSEKNFSVWTIYDHAWATFSVPPNSFISDAYITQNNIFYIAGEFNSEFFVQKFDGIIWTSIGEFSQASPSSMVVYDSLLYIVGDFADVNDVPNTKYVCAYNGTSWQSVTTNPEEFQGIKIVATFQDDLYFAGKRLLKLSEYTTGVENVPKISTVYPNPASDYIICSMSERGVLAVYSMIGTRMPIELSRKGGQVQIDVSSFPNGLYYLKTKDRGTKFEVLH